MASYLLNDGAEWFVYVGDTYSDWTLYVDGQEAQIVSDAVRSRWYVTDHRPEHMELRHAPLSRAVAYRLPEGTQIEGLARELSADEFKEQFPRDDDYVLPVIPLHAKQPRLALSWSRRRKTP